jgi:hypothetical protein
MRKSSSLPRRSLNLYISYLKRRSKTSMRFGVIYLRKRKARAVSQSTKKLNAEHAENSPNCINYLF